MEVEDGTQVEMQRHISKRRERTRPLEHPEDFVTSMGRTTDWRTWCGHVVNARWTACSDAGPTCADCIDYHRRGDDTVIDCMGGWLDRRGEPDDCPICCHNA